jgi:hypothetical protein
MGISYGIDGPQRRVYVQGFGTITATELFDTQRQLIEDPAFESTFSQLFDLTQAVTVEISSTQMSALADRTAFTRGARRAIVVSRPLLFGLTRMFGLIADAKGGDLEIFSDVIVAERWLDGGLESPSPRPDEAVEEQ